LGKIWPPSYDHIPNPTIRRDSLSQRRKLGRAWGDEDSGGGARDVSSAILGLNWVREGQKENHPKKEKGWERGVKKRSQVGPQKLAFRLGKKKRKWACGVFREAGKRAKRSKVKIGTTNPRVWEEGEWAKGGLVLNKIGRSINAEVFWREAQRHILKGRRKVKGKG